MGVDRGMDAIGLQGEQHRRVRPSQGDLVDGHRGQLRRGRDQPLLDDALVCTPYHRPHEAHHDDQHDDGDTLRIEPVADTTEPPVALESTTNTGQISRLQEEVDEAVHPWRNDGHEWDADDRRDHCSDRPLPQRKAHQRRQLTQRESEDPQEEPELVSAPIRLVLVVVWHDSHRGRDRGIVIDSGWARAVSGPGWARTVLGRVLS